MEKDINFNMNGGGYGYGGGYGGYGCGYGGFGAGGGFLGGLILGSIFNRRGFGDGGHCHTDGGGDYSRAGYGSGAANLGYMMGKSAGEDAKYRDVVDATSTLNGAIRNGFDFTNANINRLDTSVLTGFGGLDKSICENKYDALIQFKELSHQMSMQHCAIEKAISCDGEKTRLMIANQNEEALRVRLNEAERQRDLLATGNFPISQPAHVHRHHCHDRGDEVQVQINNINQQVAALGSVVGQNADAVNRLIGQLGK